MYLLAVTLLVFTQKTKNEPYQGSNKSWVDRNIITTKYDRYY